MTARFSFTSICRPRPGWGRAPALGGTLKTRFNLMAKILLAASLAVVAAFGGFSVYIDGLQRNETSRGVAAEIASSGELAAASIANWLNARVMLTESAALDVAKAADTEAVFAAFDTPLMSREFAMVYFGGEVARAA